MAECRSKVDLRFSGGIPVELGDLVKLTYLNLRGNRLTGASVCSIIHVRCMFADIFPFCRKIAQGARQPRQIDRTAPERKSFPRRVVCSVLHFTSSAHDRVLYVIAQ